MWINRKGIPFIIAIWLVTVFRGALGSLNASSPPPPGSGWRLIAQEKASDNSDPSFFGVAPRWVYPAQAISIRAIPRNASERTVVFGDEVTILFNHLPHNSPLALELSFLSDSTDRAERIMAGSLMLQDRIQLPFATVLRKSWLIPISAIHNGSLKICAERLTGPNAVICGFRLYSSDPKALPIHPVSFRINPLMVPHIIEQPSYACGISPLRISLNGEWNFKTDILSNGSWSRIHVPGEWTMQSYTVPDNGEAVYRRKFSLPASWKRGEVILKCAGVYSEARVFINGRYAGMHIGGFTQFELDITPYLRYDTPNVMSVYVRSGSLADRLASGIQYAAHDLGGITRDIHLELAPKTYLQDIHIVTHFDPSYRNARLMIGVSVVGKSKTPSRGLSLHYTLKDPSGKITILSDDQNSLPAIELGMSRRVHYAVWVKSPLKWDSEHPNLYMLNLELLKNKHLLEKVSVPFGFRQIDIRGNRLFVNNHPVKLRGVCRHETDPLRGRSLPPGMGTRDVSLLRSANVNVIRTSHYPPSDEFIRACDKLGMFVEEEAPFCWANPSSPKDAAYVIQAEMEMSLRDRNDPCVLQWSLGNESPWSVAFEAGYRAIRALDKTRPCLFDGGSGQPIPPLDIEAPHYPGLAAPAIYAHSRYPVFIGEESHIECYNRNELLTDPGLRDIWELGFSQMWRNMRRSQGCEGGDIWAGIDDIFFMPSGKIVGYGPWGIIDEWRRPKPEYWEVKKVYSPVRVTEVAYRTGRHLELQVRNRELFTNLSELRFIWSVGNHIGSAHCEASPGHNCFLRIPIRFPIRTGDSLLLKIYSPLHYLVDAYAFPLGKRLVSKYPHFQSIPLQTKETDGVYTVRGKGFDVLLSAATGRIVRIVSGGEIIANGGPDLVLEPISGEDFGQITDSGKDIKPFNRLWTGWKAKIVTMSQTNAGVAFHVEGECNEAKGNYNLLITPVGELKFDTDFVSKVNDNLWQEGWTLDTPLTCNKLWWDRKARWSYYPKDHIGRPIGVAYAHDGKPMTGPLGPASKPSWSWSQDDTLWGTNDFRSTKRNVYTAVLSAKDGAGLAMLSNGSQNIRCWISDKHIRMFLMAYGNEGTAPFFNQRMIPYWKLQPGSLIRNSFTLQILPPHPGI